MVHGNRFLAERDRETSNCSILLAAACFLPQLHAITAWLANPVVCLSGRELSTTAGKKRDVGRRFRMGAWPWVCGWSSKQAARLDRLRMQSEQAGAL